MRGVCILSTSRAWMSGCSKTSRKGKKLVGLRAGTAPRYQLLEVSLLKQPPVFWSSGPSVSAVWCSAHGMSGGELSRGSSAAGRLARPFSVYDRNVCREYLWKCAPTSGTVLGEGGGPAIRPPPGALIYTGGMLGSATLNRFHRSDKDRVVQMSPRLPCP